MKNADDSEREPGERPDHPKPSLQNPNIPPGMLGKGPISIDLMEQWGLRRDKDYQFDG